MAEPIHDSGRTLDLLRESEALLEGHFLLSSGRHSVKDEKMKKKRFLFFLVIVASVLLVLILSHSRRFYKIQDLTFTFWKTKNGCYIMPYKYFGITIPKENYIKKPSNTGGIIIFIGEESMFYIFPTMNSETGAEIIEFNLSSSYKYFPFTGEIGYIAFEDTIEDFKKQGYPYICVYITGTMAVEIGNL